MKGDAGLLRVALKQISTVAEGLDVFLGISGAADSPPHDMCWGEAETSIKTAF